MFHGTWLAHLANVHFIVWAVGLGGSGLFLLALGMALLRDRINRGAEASSAGLNYVVGPMGSGKSMFGVRTIIAALAAGKYVVTNVRLLDGWAPRVAAHEWAREVRKGPAELRRLERLLLGHYVYERDLRTAMRYRVPCARCGADVKVCGHSGPEQEGRAVFVWDETHNDLNNRDYQGYGVDRNERELEKERRRLVVRWATQLRKLGFCGFLLSQHHENTDAQLRRVCNHIIRLQNQRNAEGLWLARLLPRRLTLFLVYWYPAHLATGVPEHLIKSVRREHYWLPWFKNLYDSWETYADIDALDDENAPILLPAHGTYPDAASAPRSGKAASRRRLRTFFPLRIVQSKPAASFAGIDGGPLQTIDVGQAVDARSGP